MLAEFLQELIVRTAPTEFLTTNNDKVFSKELFNPPLPDEPLYPTVVVHSLAGFCDALGISTLVSVIVCSAREVVALGPEFGQRRQRDVFVKATCPTPLKSWNYQPLEDFRIHLVTSFAPTAARAALLERIATVKDEAITTSEDDGVTQKVTAKVGISSVGQVALPPVIKLAQVRSFEDVEQIETPYLFRLRKGTMGIEAALFEVQTGWETKQARLVAESVKGMIGGDFLVVY